MALRPRIAALVACLLLAGGACGESANANQRGGRGGRGGGKGGKAEAPMPVTVTSVQVTTIDRHYRASGTLAARQWAEIRPIGSGILRSIGVEEGDTVSAGQELARLDAREAGMMAKRDKLAAKNAQRELERLQAIANTNAIAAEELDKQRYEMETAKASAKLSKHQASLTTIRAPFSGTVVSRKVDVGNLATNATVLFEIGDLSALELELHLPEREASRVQLETQVEITLIDETAFTGSVIRRAPVVDPTTGTVKFTVRAEKFPAAAVPGSFVRARVLLESRANVSSVPRSAVFEVDGADHVYTVIEGKAQRVPVTVGIEGDDRVEITDGLTTEQVVIVDANGMTDGMALTPVQEGAGEADPAGS